MTTYHTAGYARRRKRMQRRQQRKAAAAKATAIGIWFSGVVVFGVVGLWLGLFVIDVWMPGHPEFQGELCNRIAFWR